MITKKKLLITKRALRDISNIEAYSTKKWGKSVANKYISDLEKTLDLIQESPSILIDHEDFNSSLSFYSIKKHLLVFDQSGNSIILLCVFHSSMDIVKRLKKLQSSLSKEVELLSLKLKKQGK